MVALEAGAQPNGAAEITTGDALIAQDLATYSLEGTKVPTNDGGTVICKRSTYRKEQTIIKLLKDVIVPMVQLGFQGENLDGEQAAKLTGMVLDTAPENLAAAAAILLDRATADGKPDVDWVGDNLVIETIVGLVIPFFVNKWNLTRAALAPLLAPLGNVVGNTSSSGLNSPPQ